MDKINASALNSQNSYSKQTSKSVENNTDSLDSIFTKVKNVVETGDSLFQKATKFEGSGKVSEYGISLKGTKAVAGYAKIEVNNDIDIFGSVSHEFEKNDNAGKIAVKYRF